ncbi:DUF4241 domain-containing protein [Streptomyces thermolilacinus]|uniref:DUF4241 domain-containing protein n=1 Tax=Streptomyces thermolilacinus SPC6 TaxID=1306406 RepID=A0A1D3DYN7_9ACTN|nr:DUF4241 domain-containing protein [Streptomyces thermolilacinus]OEJ97424.1 hypothetical protein J116_026180 [Streptomyces thermolilacinus SPC6]
MGGDQGPGTVVEVAYALAWDLEARTPWRPLTAEAARQRDAAGLPYVVVYRTPGREAPLEVRLVSWRDHYVGLWLYDDQGRRTDELDLRLLDDPSLLLCRRTRTWRYTGPEMAEFDDECPRSSVELFPDGTGSVSEEPRGARGGMLVTSPDAGARRWQVRPGFEDWPVVAALWTRVPGPVVLRATAPVSDTAASDTAASDAADAPATCWRPPRPAQPGPLDALFRPGTRVTDGYHSEMTVLEPRRTGTLRVPSGLLAVSSPDSACDEGPAITVPVPPGEYVLEEAQVRVGYDCEWSGRWVTRTDTTAVRLRVSEAPAASWEMALGPDDDPRLLGENEIFGFGTDGATGCFADAGAWERLQRLHERHVVHGEEGVGEDIPDSMFSLRTRDAASGGELVAFATTGDGTYPVWLGRSADGEPTEVVVLVDGMMTVLQDDGADRAQAVPA